MNEITKAGSFSLAPQNLEQAMKFAEIMANSDLVPKDFRGKPGNVLVAVQMGSEVGMPPTQAIQNIAVVNGRPCLWGDGLLAVCQSSGNCEYITETFDEKTMTATCRAKRKNSPHESVSTFSQADAKVAGLWGKQGPWTSSPKRMLQMRARGFCLRDTFADVLRGMDSAEAQEIGHERDVTPKQEARPERTTYPDDRFAENLPKWAAMIESGKKTPEDIIKTIESKSDLSEGQRQIIEDLDAVEGEYQGAESAA